MASPDVLPGSSDLEGTPNHDFEQANTLLRSRLPGADLTPENLKGMSLRAYLQHVGAKTISLVRPGDWDAILLDPYDDRQEGTKGFSTVTPISTNGAPFFHIELVFCERPSEFYSGQERQVWRRVAGLSPYKEDGALTIPRVDNTEYILVDPSFVPRTRPGDQNSIFGTSRVDQLIDRL